MSIKETVLRLAPKLNGYIASRMPYTYHHDCIRSILPGDLSRAYVAQCYSKAPDDHLYSVAMYYLLKHADSTDLFLAYDHNELRELHKLFTIAKENIKKTY